MPLSLTKAEALAFQKKVREDPLWFQKEVLKRTLWEKEKEIILAVRDNKEVSVRSCNASGKTYTASGIVHQWLLGYENSVVITTAPTGRQVREVLWREIRGAVSGKKLYRLDQVLETKINIDDEWFALGLSTDEPDQFQGFHSPHLLVIVDEASGVNNLIFEAIDGLEPERTLLIGNPLNSDGRFADSFKDPQVKKIHISAFDTPNVTAGNVVVPGLITVEDVEKFKQRYGEDSDVYRVRVLGQFPKTGVESFISIDEVSKAIERDVDVLPQWEKKLGVDVARFGDDRTILTVRQMEKIIRKEIIGNSDLMQVVGRILAIRKEEHILSENIFVDVIGVGAGVVDRLKEQGFDVNEVNV